MLPCSCRRITSLPERTRPSESEMREALSSAIGKALVVPILVNNCDVYGACVYEIVTYIYIYATCFLSRVMGELAVSRAFGDVDFKKGIQSIIEQEGGLQGAGG
ncbi:hypothetical protein EON64_17705, partial [archaeon]